MKFKITVTFVFIVLIGSFAAFYYTKYFFNQTQANRSVIYPEKGDDLIALIKSNQSELFDYTGKAFRGVPLDDRLPSDNGARVFHFWAGWCDPCINEMPEVLKFVKSIQERNRIQVNQGKSTTQVFLISLDFDVKDLAKVIKIFPELNQLDFVHIWDKSNLLSRKSAVEKLPVTFVDRGGVKMQVYEGEANWRKILAETL